MSTAVVTRTARRPAPEIPAGEILIEPPPPAPSAGGPRWQHLVQLLPMLTGTVASALLFAGRGGGTYSYLVGAVFGVSTLGMLATSWGGAGPRRAEVGASRREYLRHLAVARRRARNTVAAQRAGGYYRHPDPDRLWSTVDSYRLWERRRGDADFAVVRVGVGPQALATPLVPPLTGAVTELEPVTAAALRRFLDSYSVVPDLPVALSLRAFDRVLVRALPDAGGQPWGAGPAPSTVDPPGGERAAVLGLVRAVLAQLAVFHAPEDLLVAVCARPERHPEWDWVKWLPHARHPTRSDLLGPVRLVAGSLAELEDQLGDVLDGRPRFDAGTAAGAAPHLVVVLDGAERGGRRLTAEPGLQGVTLIDLDPHPVPDPGHVVGPGRLPGPGRAGAPGSSAYRLGPGAVLLDPTGPGRALTMARADGRTGVGTADALGHAEAEALARRLAPRRLARQVGPVQPSTGPAPGLTGLLGVADPYAYEVSRAWRPRAERDRLRVPIGVGPDGRTVELDLKESAQGGMGPHGLLIGATGSGKSELLRTLVLGLAAAHSSELLNLVLVDFKGGATFASLDRLPHVAAVITNLAEELPLVDRMTEAVNGELVRRQELLRRAGNVASLRDYEAARAAGAPLAALPSLLIVCDEFSELLAAKPDFIDLFLQIGRVGRSLGVHLLLASQRLDEGRLRGLETHLSYRIGLRTFSALESRTVLGVPDAYELPPAPGHGYLKYGTEPLARFTAAYVSGPWRTSPTRSGAVPAAGRCPTRVLAFTARYVAAPAPGPATGADEPSLTQGSAGGADEPARPRDGRGPATADGHPAAESPLDIVVARLAGQGVPARRIWLPPLSAPPSLDDLLGPVEQDAARGLTVADPRRRGALRVPVALVDRPFEQRRDALWLHLDSAAGHVAVVGGPQSGKSTALRTLVTALALTHTPREVQVYCLDFGGGQLAALRTLPHVGGVAARQEAAAVRRTVGEVATLLADRERRGAAGGAEARPAQAGGPEATRPQADGPQAGGAAGDRFGDVFLVIDGWSTLRGEFEDLEPVVVDVATRGLSYGVHVVAAAARWMDFRPAVRDLFGSRLELRLGDPGDSQVSRRAAANVPERSPGRGLTPESLHLLTALPRLTGGEPAELTAAIAKGWAGPSAPAVRLLPSTVDYSAVEDAREPANPLALPIGLAEADLRPALVDFAAEPHFLLFGDDECGKSSFLRALATTLTRRFTPEQARLILVDYRRSLLGAVGRPHLIGYATGPTQTRELVESVAGYMRARLPDAQTPPEPLADGGWWTGPRCFVLVDDYDLVATAAGNPLLPLLDHLGQARDIGLHLVVARRSGGAGRSLYEPVVQRLRELSSPGLVMSGDRDEGPLLGGVRPCALPPGRGLLVTRKEGVRLVHLATPPFGTVG